VAGLLRLANDLSVGRVLEVQTGFPFLGSLLHVVTPMAQLVQKSRADDVYVLAHPFCRWDLSRNSTAVTRSNSTSVLVRVHP